MRSLPPSKRRPCLDRRARCRRLPTGVSIKPAARDASVLEAALAALRVTAGDLDRLGLTGTDLARLGVEVEGAD